MGIYTNAGQLVDQLRVALERGEPMIVLGPPLMQSAIAILERGDDLVQSVGNTLGRCDRVLDRVDTLLAATERLIVANTELLALERRRLELTIAKMSLDEG